MGKDIDEKIYSKKFNYIGTRDAIYDALSQIFYERFKIDDSLSKKTMKEHLSYFLSEFFEIYDAVIGDEEAQNPNNNTEI